MDKMGKSAQGNLWMLMEMSGCQRLLEFWMLPHTHTKAHWIDLSETGEYINPVIYHCWHRLSRSMTVVSVDNDKVLLDRALRILITVLWSRQRGVLYPFYRWGEIRLGKGKWQVPVSIAWSNKGWLTDIFCLENSGDWETPDQVTSYL